MTEREFQDVLHDAIIVGLEGDPVADVRSFEDAGLLTRNRGLVVRLEDGSAFQVSIVQSECADDDADEED